MKGLGNEVAKNLVLAGVGSLTIVDDDLVTEDDLGAQFFLSEEHIGLTVRIRSYIIAYC
jgi:ubiquitin-like 1-activating enzyme E1 A